VFHGGDGLPELGDLFALFFEDGFVVVAFGFEVLFVDAVAEGDVVQFLLDGL
jgi:hypothetical protein